MTFEPAAVVGKRPHVAGKDEREPELDTDMVLEQGDELLRSSRDLLADIDRQLQAPVNNPGDSLRTNEGRAGDT